MGLIKNIKKPPFFANPTLWGINENATMTQLFIQPTPPSAASTLRKSRVFFLNPVFEPNSEEFSMYFGERVI